MHCHVRPGATCRGAGEPLIAILDPPYLMAPQRRRGPERRHPAGQSGGSEPGSSRGQRVMIVEDDFLVAMGVENSLADAGYVVTAVVTSGEAALVEAERDRPDLVLMDIRLAGELDGIETACRLLALGIRCVFASAHSDAGTLERGAAAEPLGWLTKPFSPKQLLAAVTEALRPDSLN